MSYTKLPPLGQANMENSLPVVFSSDQSPLPLAGVHFQDLYITGQGSQLAANQNILLATAGSGSYDTQVTGISYRTVHLQINVASGTVTAGTVVFEGSNDNTNWSPVFLFNSADITAAPVSTYNPAANTPRYFQGSIGFRYFRVRISVTVTGTTTGLQAFSVFSPNPYTASRQTILGASSQSIGQIGAVNAVTPGTAATNLGKARDSVAGATDTGVAGLFIRRDTPAAVTSAVGEYEPAQIDSNGSQWVRLAGEIVDDAAFGVGTTRVLPVGFLADEVSTDSVDEGDGGAARMTRDRKQIAANYAHTAGGWTAHVLISAATVNATSLKASAGQVGGFQVFNTNASPRYLKFYDKASAPTVGTDTPVKVIMIPGNSAGAGAIMGSLAGVEFTTGIAYALTTGIANNDTGAVALNEIAVNIDWK